MEILEIMLSITSIVLDAFVIYYICKLSKKEKNKFAPIPQNID